MVLPSHTQSNWFTHIQKHTNPYCYSAVISLQGFRIGAEPGRR